MTETCFAKVRTVSDHCRPAIILTSKGTFQVKRGMKRAEYQTLIRELNQLAGSDEYVSITYVPQTGQSGSRHTLLSMQ